eukprot:Clim_evm116s134 gene=Clim_evmTU116s134
MIAEDMTADSISLSVRVCQAKSLRKADIMSSDPYAKVIVGEQDFKTKVKTFTCKPKWDEQYTFATVDSGPLRVEVWDHDDVSADDLLGVVEFKINEIATDGYEKKWYPLEDPGRKKQKGEIELEIRKLWV